MQETGPDVARPEPHRPYKKSVTNEREEYEVNLRAIDETLRRHVGSRDRSQLVTRA